MIHHSMICAGIDVSKTRLDIAIHPGGAHLSVAYDAAGLKQLDALVAAKQAGEGDLYSLLI